MKRYIITTAIILITTTIAWGQYIQFSQYYASPTVLAPSFTGAIENSRFNANWRDQWTKIPGTFVTYAAGFDKNVPKINSGFGFLVVRDQAGTGNLARTEFGVLYSWYGLLNRLTELYIRPGIELKLTQRSVDINALIFPDQLLHNGNPQTQPSSQPIPEEPNKYNFDGTASILLYNRNFWVGSTVDHLFRPAEYFYDQNYRVPIKYSAFGGYRFQLRGGGYKSYSSIQDYLFISGYFRMQATNTQFDIGGYWDHQPLIVGLWARGIPTLNRYSDPNIDAIVILVGYRIFSFTIGYSYDITVSPMLGRTGGSHEISITYNFYSNLKSKRRDGPLPCPGI